MAEQKQTYPMLPISHWWTLRKKFRQSIPGVVTDGYLATVLGMGKHSARANVLPFLKVMGIIDDDGKTGERAKKWRDDDQYAKVCQEILADVYPQELRDAVTEPAQRPQAAQWFSNATGSGEGAANRMAAQYVLLLEADATKQAEQDKGERPRKAAQERPSRKDNGMRASTPTPSAQQSLVHPPPSAPHIPGININLEIHISADSTPEQIEQIFASMAKHIYKAG